jgi:excisionase family DNA binding protein
MNDVKELMTVGEASVLSGYSERHIRRLAREGRVEAQQAGGWMYLIDRDSLMGYVEKMQELGESKHSPNQ